MSESTIQLQKKQQELGGIIDGFMVFLGSEELSNTMNLRNNTISEKSEMELINNKKHRKHKSNGNTVHYYQSDFSVNKIIIHLIDCVGLLKKIR